MPCIWSRRAVLLTLAAAARASDRSSAIASELRRFRDPATEFELLRLTDPAHGNAVLPRPPLRAISNKSNSLIYCSDRSGSVQAYHMDLKTGESRQVTTGQSVDPESVSLWPDEKTLLYRDGNTLVLLGRKGKAAYTAESGWEAVPGFSVSDDGTVAGLVEHRSGRYRLRMVRLAHGEANTIFEAPTPVQYVRFRPKRQQVLYNASGVLTLVGFDGREPHRVKIADGTAGEALWSADGRTIHYLSIPRERNRVIQMRDHFPETAEDSLVGPTTQFTSFARNADSTVFAGISGSKAAPYVLLLVRAGRRELTVAEHRASTPARAVVAFSPNSQRLFFASDREGKSAIYSIALERFVEKTEASAGGIGRAERVTS